MGDITKTSGTDFIIGATDPILITGATGFIGSRVVSALLNLGFTNLRCFARPSSRMDKLQSSSDRPDSSGVKIVMGNLLSREDCVSAAKDVAVIYHLAAGSGEKSIPDAFANSVVTTRNLLEAALRHNSLKRFVNISSFAVYSNRNKPGGRLLDETCPVEVRPEIRGDAYTFAKVKQDEIVEEYGRRFGIPHVTLRPGYVYGPGKLGITGRVGIGTFGIFLHLGGSNPIPVTYVDNCAEAIALAGLKPGVDGQVFNVVDDNLPSSRKLLRQYKQNVRHFRSLYVPHFLSYALSDLWERYSEWSHGQLPPAFNRARWHAVWKKTTFSNQKLKTQLGWSPRVSTQDGLQRYFEACRIRGVHA